jgi:hypothetical protein
MMADWQDNLTSLLEELRLIEECKAETPENFKQFCEFIAEPAFENLSTELKEYGTKARFKTKKKRSISFTVNFPKSSVDNFHYIISLPKNSIQLKLKLKIRWRKTKKSIAEEKDLPFMKDVFPSEVLKISKEKLITDVIKQYKNFTYKAYAKSEE